jgi:hypothetical protein
MPCDWWDEVVTVDVTFIHFFLVTWAYNQNVHTKGASFWHYPYSSAFLFELCKQ